MKEARYLNMMLCGSIYIKYKNRQNKTGQWLVALRWGTGSEGEKDARGCLFFNLDAGDTYVISVLFFSVYFTLESRVVCVLRGKHILNEHIWRIRKHRLKKKKRNLNGTGSICFPNAVVDSL